MRLPYSLCIYLFPYVHPFHKLLNAERIFMKLGMYIMRLEPISTPYFTNPSHQSVYLNVYFLYRC
jgi:hypothetical protein